MSHRVVVSGKQSMRAELVCLLVAAAMLLLASEKLMAAKALLTAG